ncbi:YciI family protein [Nocardia sp. NBC_00565]|uniref:YciI family protein n=1 Tax=Nocardia sp. NBC_00565 TaxID=2975993 RepID=UPI002E82372A|nr:YciI family protein [Nocardia sp. NBC_00565]WUC07740.1 YciI family protein [Nocardia sp. NBC_00565]
MSIFAVHYTYSEATVAGRDTHRPEHRAWLSGLIEAGSLLSSGPYADGSGALLLFQAADEGALEELLAQDPFAREKLIDAVRAVEWLPVMGTFSA